MNECVFCDCAPHLCHFFPNVAAAQHAECQSAQRAIRRLRHTAAARRGRQTNCGEMILGSSRKHQHRNQNTPIALHHPFSLVEFDKWRILHYELILFVASSLSF
jgi:hypothetical protein